MTTSERRVQLQAGYVLHHRPYRNTSLILDVFTRDRGRISLVARGARTAKSRWYSLCQPFRPLLLSWSGRADLATLTDLDSTARAWPLTGKLLFSAYYLNELLMRLLQPLDPHPELFQHYVHALDRLVGLPNTGQRPEVVSFGLQSCLRMFEKYLLQEIGYGLILDHDVHSGAPIAAEGRYQYVLEIGPVPGDNDNRDAISMSGSSLLGLARDDLSAPQCLQESKKLMRAALARYLGDKPLYTRALLRQLDYKS